MVQWVVEKAVKMLIVVFNSVSIYTVSFKQTVQIVFLNVVEYYQVHKYIIIYQKITAELFHNYVTCSTMEGFAAVKKSL